MAVCTFCPSGNVTQDWWLNGNENGENINAVTQSRPRLNRVPPYYLLKGTFMSSAVALSFK